jgi:hypothetical protein
MAGDKKPNLSKSQYILGQQCSLALWNYRYGGFKKTFSTRAAYNDSIEAGHHVGNLAHDYFGPNSGEVTNGYRDKHGAVKATKQFIADGKDVIYEATAINPADGGFCRIDALRRVPGTDEWDLVEVKSTLKPKPYHLDDLAYQYHVFTGAGYKIRDCFLMLIDPSFVKQGPVDAQKYFKLHNVTKDILSRQAAIPAAVARLGAAMDPQKAPVEEIGSRCSYPFECNYKSTCWKGAPLYTIFNAYSAKDAADLRKQTGSIDVKDVPAHLLPTKDAKLAEITAHRTGREHVNVPALQGFLKKLEYPLYYLDYETAMGVIPVYDGTRPLQQVPFQFSLHIQDTPGGPLRHHAYIHKDRGDPRDAFAKELIKVCGTKGSVIVYFQEFEEGRNKETAADLPQHAAALNAISARMVDLFEPFSNRWLYSPDQKGSVSIKKVLDAFTPLNYNAMNIPNGEIAQKRYMDFVNGTTTDAAELQQLWTDLDDYCALDTIAMVKLVDVLTEKAKGPPAAMPGGPAVK